MVGISGRNLLQGLEQSGFLITTVKPKIIWPNAATHLTREVLKIILEFIIEQLSLLNGAALHNHSVMSFLHIYENNHSVSSGLIIHSQQCI